VSLQTRLILIIVFVFGWAAAIMGRLVNLQVMHGDEYQIRAEKQHLSEITLSAKRGTISDSQGEILAVNIDVPTIYADPEEILDPAAISAQLASQLGYTEARLTALLSQEKRFVYLKRKISHQLRDQIASLDIRGIHFLTESKRIFPLGRIAGHVVGHVGIDNNGLAGIELAYEKHLKGKPGKMRGVRGGKSGYSFSEGVVVKAPTRGRNIRLTINARLQFAAETELAKQMEITQAESGVVVAMNPHTGAILAMANYPDFDPGDVVNSTSESRKNRAVLNAYEPGSTFKIITAAAALEAGVVSLEDEFDCQMGSIVVAGRRIKDHSPFGVLSFRDVIANSSNVGTIKVAQLVGESRLWNMADRFGYGQNSGIDFRGENHGILRSPDKWGRSSYASISIGQEVSGNAVQILLNAAIVANGGNWVKPHLVEEIRGLDGSLIYQAQPEKKKILSENVVLQLRELLRGVVIKGGGKGAAIKGINVSGKTGTAQIALPGQGYVDGKYLSSFLGYFPAENPEVVLLCMISEPVGKYYGSQIAAPLFANIAEQLANELEIPRQGYWQSINAIASESYLTQFEASAPTNSRKRTIPNITDSLVMPDLAGLPVKEAISRCLALGVVPEIDGSGFVNSQSPAAGTTINSQVTLFCNGIKVATLENDETEAIIQDN
jgi:cell division protein FtsI/penicillin-binding protein 2